MAVHREHAGRRGRMRLGWISGFLVLASLGSAAAQPTGASGPDGTIVQLERGTAYVDVGASRGLRPGAVLQVLRTVTAKHPAATAHCSRSSMPSLTRR